MLKELNKYENLGTLKYFQELFEILTTTEKSYRVVDVQHHFFNRVIDDQKVFDGCLPMLIDCDILSTDDEGVINFQAYFKEVLVTEECIRSKLLEHILKTVKTDADFLDIFSSENMSLDVVYQTLQIQRSAFGFKYYNFLKLLLELNFLVPHPDFKDRVFIINNKYKSLFDINILPEIKRRKIGLEEQKKQREINVMLGEEAEAYALQFEINRLNNKPGIEQVSTFWSNAGFDIVSFETADSEALDRFVEVKSYSINPRFYWSRNEVEVSKLRGDSYYLYLVDRSQLQNLDYVPLIIKNPYKELICTDNDWEKIVEKYCFTYQL